ESGATEHAAELPTLHPSNVVNAVASAPAESVSPVHEHVSTASDGSNANAANAPILVASLEFDQTPSQPPVVITEDKLLKLSLSEEGASTLETSKPMHLLNASAESSTEKPEKYVRGQTLIESPASEGADGSKKNDTSGRELPLVIGGKPRGGPNDGSITASSARFYASIRYMTSLAAALSLSLLAFFYVAYLDPRLLWPAGGRWTPNAWEFVLYTQYLQQTMSLSALTLLKTPYFLWEFTDTFSWTNFLVRLPGAADDDGGSDSSAEARRRLKTIVLDGLVGYSDRIGLDENKIMCRCVYTFALVMLALAGAFGAVKVIGRLVKREVAAFGAAPSGSRHLTALESVALRVRGLGVLAWYFALFPLSLMASFEMTMEVQANLIETWPMTLSAAALFGVCSAGLAYAAWTVLKRTERQLRSFSARAVWGALYADYAHATRLFFLFGAALQVVTGSSIGVFGSSSTLLVMLVALQLTYLFGVVVVWPFAHNVALGATCAVGVVRVVNLGLAFAFLQSSTLASASRERVANAYLGFNAALIAAWLLRLLVVFCSCVAAYSSRDDGPMTPVEAMPRLPIGKLRVRTPEERGYATTRSPIEAAHLAPMTISDAHAWSHQHWLRVV
ncbi:hypothetical protein PybrP1_011859, partial [[Pythium] brassicae (nom. inval.)]